MTPARAVARVSVVKVDATTVTVVDAAVVAETAKWTLAPRTAAVTAETAKWTLAPRTAAATAETAKWRLAPRTAAATAETAKGLRLTTKRSNPGLQGLSHALLSFFPWIETFSIASITVGDLCGRMDGNELEVRNEKMCSYF
jgi:hypothetical protein